MKHLLLLALNLIICIVTSNAQNVSVKVTENGKPMAYHNVTISHGDLVIGTGKTDNRGYASIYCNGLRGKAVDVAGDYKNGGTSKKWSIKGKLRLDNNNHVDIKLEEIGKDMKENSDIFKMPDFPLGNNSNSNNNNGSTQEENKSSANSKSLSSKQFNAELNDIKNTSSSFSKADKAQALVKNNALSSAQIKEVLSALSSSFAQKDLAIAAYPNCTDPQNYQSVINTMSSSLMRKEVEAATINKR